MAGLRRSSLASLSDPRRPERQAITLIWYSARPARAVRPAAASRPLVSRCRDLQVGVSRGSSAGRPQLVCIDRRPALCRMPRHGHQQLSTSGDPDLPAVWLVRTGRYVLRGAGEAGKVASEIASRSGFRPSTWRAGCPVVSGDANPTRERARKKPPRASGLGGWGRLPLAPLPGFPCPTRPLRPAHPRSYDVQTQAGMNCTAAADQNLFASTWVPEGLMLPGARPAELPVNHAAKSAFSDFGLKPGRRSQAGAVPAWLSDPSGAACRPCNLKAALFAFEGWPVRTHACAACCFQGF